MLAKVILIHYTRIQMRIRYWLGLGSAISCVVILINASEGDSDPSVAFHEQVVKPGVSTMLTIPTTSAC
ncbi:hypothetical protein ACHQM5_024018 [Ranunculus cassubicifolius]